MLTFLPALFFCAFSGNMKKNPNFLSLFLSHIININHLSGFLWIEPGCSLMNPGCIQGSLGGFPFVHNGTEDDFTFPALQHYPSKPQPQEPSGDSVRFQREGCATSVPPSWAVFSVFLFWKLHFFLGIEGCLINPRRDQGGHGLGKRPAMSWMDKICPGGWRSALTANNTSRVDTGNISLSLDRIFRIFTVEGVLPTAKTF